MQIKYVFILTIIYIQKKYNKTYSGYHDTSKRLAWEENLRRIQKHNEEAAQGLHSYTIKDNHLSDLVNTYIATILFKFILCKLCGVVNFKSQQHYLQKMVKLTKSKHRKIANPDEVVGDFYHKLHHLPEEINWIDKGFHTPVYNQKDCGSCYAFSIASVIQAQVFKQTNKLVPLRYFI